MGCSAGGFLINWESRRALATERPTGGGQGSSDAACEFDWSYAKNGCSDAAAKTAYLTVQRFMNR